MWSSHTCFGRWSICCIRTDWWIQMTDRLLTFKGYHGSVEVSLEDDCLHGQLLFINDLVTYEADRPAALQSAFESAVDHYLETCEAEGIPADKPFSGTFNVRTSPAQHRALAIVAASKSTSLNDIVKECFDAYLAHVNIEHTSEELAPVSVSKLRA